MRFDASNAEARVFTFKEGLLSAVAHDLQIEVTRFSIEWDEAARRLEARFDAKSLRVRTAMKDGRESPGTLSDSNKEEIQRNIQEDVLDADRFPEVVFTSSRVEREGDALRVVGILALHGRTREIEVRVVESDGRRIGEVVLHQPDFGIKPYSAMLGTLKVKPDVRVRISVPASGYAV